MNYPAWDLYLTVANQFGHDFHVDVVALMDRLKIRQPRQMLKKLALIYQCHLDNQKDK